VQKTGNKSYYLWKKKLDSVNQTIPKTGGNIALSNYKITLAPNFYQDNLVFEMNPTIGGELDQNTRSVGGAMIISAKNILGTIIDQFNNLFTLEVDFSSVDLAPYDSATLAIYSSPDGENWTKENTSVNLEVKIATAQLDHLTYFALMAQRADTIAPTTNAVLAGTHGEENWYRSNVTLGLEGEDNEGGLGVEYTLYRMPGEDWEKYTTPLIFTQEGEHRVEFYSVDLDENIELPQTVTFSIDKKHPEIDIYFDTDAKDIVFVGTDSASIVKTIQLAQQEKTGGVISTDMAGNKVQLHIKNKEKDPHFSSVNIFSIEYDAGESFLPLENKLQINYQIDEKKPDPWEKLDQSWKVSDELIIKLDFDSYKNTTSVSEKTLDNKKIKKVAEGMKILQLKTNNGILEYRY